MKPLPPDEWEEQQAGPWMRAEVIQGAFRKGFEDEGDEHFQREWEKRKVKDDQQASEKRLKEKLGR